MDQSESAAGVARDSRATSRRRGVRIAAVALAAVVVSLVVAHLLRPWAIGLSLTAYAVADVGGLAFLARYARTDWRAHPWGRHVMAFMLCLELLFTLALSRRVFGDWPGLLEISVVASWVFAGIVWWRYRLQVLGERRAGSD